MNIVRTREVTCTMYAAIIFAHSDAIVLLASPDNLIVAAVLNGGQKGFKGDRPACANRSNSLAVCLP